MKRVVYISPFLKYGGAAFADGLCRLPGIHLSIVAQQSLQSIPDMLKGRFQNFVQVGNTMDPQQIVNAVRKLAQENGGVDQMLSVHEELQIPVAEARQHLGLPGMHAEAAHNFRDKSRMKTILRENGIPCAKHHRAESPQEVVQFIEKVGFPIIAKPPDGLGTRNTHQIKNKADLDQLLATQSPSKAVPLQLEEFVVGDEYSFESMCLRGETIWTSFTRYYPTPLEAMKNPWIQWCLVLPKENDDPRYNDIRTIAAKANKVLGIGTSISHMEWFRRKDGSVAVSEVGSRPPGVQIMKLVSYAHDFNFYRAWCEFMVFERFQPPPRKYATGCAFLRGMGNGRVKKIHGLDEISREIGELVIHSELPKLGQSKAAGYEGEGYIIVRHPSTDIVKKALHKLITTVRVEMG